MKMEFGRRLITDNTPRSFVRKTLVLNLEFATLAFIRILLREPFALRLVLQNKVIP